MPASPLFPSLLYSVFPMVFFFLSLGGIFLRTVPVPFFYQGKERKVLFAVLLKHADAPLRNKESVHAGAPVVEQYPEGFLQEIRKGKAQRRL